MKKYLISALVLLGAAVPFALSSFSADSPEASAILFVRDRAGRSEDVAWTASATFPDKGSGGIVDKWQRQIYLSPNRQVLAVTIEPYNSHGEVFTYLIDREGNLLADRMRGSFIGWYPDSNKAMLFVFRPDNGSERGLYSLSTRGEYEPMPLPEGTISAAVSGDGRIAYAVSRPGTDDCSLWLRDSTGERQVRESAGFTYSWLSWSPDGEHVAFLQRDTELKSHSAQRVGVLNWSGEQIESTEPVVWSYPPQWSDDGGRLLFIRPEIVDDLGQEANDFDALISNVWEINVQTGTLRQVTDQRNARILHPTYSSDGNNILFISNSGGLDQVWTTGSGGSRPLTTSLEKKRYPISL